jgi:hypothetical protein
MESGQAKTHLLFCGLRKHTALETHALVPFKKKNQRNIWEPSHCNQDLNPPYWLLGKWGGLNPRALAVGVTGSAQCLKGE